MENLASVERTYSAGYRSYAATPNGIARAQVILAALSPVHSEYIRTVSSWVRSLGFTQLVKSIYEEYPEMRANSIFVG